MERGTQKDAGDDQRATRLGREAKNDAVVMASILYVKPVGSGATAYLQDTLTRAKRSDG